MSEQFIKPAREGLIVRHPETAARLPDNGARVTWSPYWQRRLEEGSVVTASPVPNNAPKDQPTTGLPAPAKVTK